MTKAIARYVMKASHGSAGMEALRSHLLSREVHQEDEQDRGEATCIENEPGWLLADRCEVYEKAR